MAARKAFGRRQHPAARVALTGHLGLPAFVDREQAERARRQGLEVGQRLAGYDRSMDRLVATVEAVETASTAAGIVLGAGVLATAVKSRGKWAIVKTAIAVGTGYALDKALDKGLETAGASPQTIRGLRLAAAVFMLILIRRRGRAAPKEQPSASPRPPAGSEPPPSPKPVAPSSSGASKTPLRKAGGNLDDAADTVKASQQGDGSRTGSYGSLLGTLEEGVQANHLNQNAAFRGVIPESEGAAIGLRGNAITEPGTPHYEFHSSLQGFWNQYRRGGSLVGSTPTNAQYGQALEQALRASGYSSREAANLAAQAAANRAAYGLSDQDLVPRVPGRLNQVPRQ